MSAFCLLQLLVSACLPAALAFYAWKYQTVLGNDLRGVILAHMRVYFVFCLPITLVLMTGCVELTSTIETRPPVFTITTQGEGNEIAASAESNISIFDAYSRSGIGSGTVEFISGTPPAKIIVRLHLKGLEEFRLVYENTTIIVSVSSIAGDAEIQRVISPGGIEQPIANDSPFWIEVKKTNDQPKSSDASDSGYFELAMPKDLVREGYRYFSIRWIDFFR